MQREALLVTHSLSMAKRFWHDVAESYALEERSPCTLNDVRAMVAYSERNLGRERDGRLIGDRSMSFDISKVESLEELARKANFRPDSMAALCSISLRQLERVFVKRFNKTPGAWARELRCRLARDLIEAGWMTKAVTRELHFTNESHLCHEFKKRYRVSPRAFARSNGNSKNVALLQ